VLKKWLSGPIKQKRSAHPFSSFLIWESAFSDLKIKAVFPPPLILTINKKTTCQVPY